MEGEAGWRGCYPLEVDYLILLVGVHGCLWYHTGIILAQGGLESSGGLL